VTVVFDRGAHVTLDRPELAAGQLEHAYALTAHRAQGATVDETFVLGGERLTREWAYTTLSRHRRQARLHVTRADIETDLPAPNATVHGLARLVGRSGAKELALDSLIDELHRAPERPIRRARDSGLELAL
jgi:ATP-dependent exoDNAse (exonuclease V) alpha subunit